MIQIGIFDKAVVHKKELLTTGFPGELGLAGIPFQLNDGCIFFNRNQFLVVGISE